MRRVLVMAVVVVATACGSVQAPAAASGPVEPGAFPLLPGDVVRLRIWREPDLSGEFRVDERGEVTFPKIGTIEAGDLTLEEVERTVRERFALYLRNPSIEIVPMRRITIHGSVRAPGLYPVDPTMTLGDALALAGGVLPNGRDDRIEVIRGGVRLITEVRGETRIGELGVRSGDQIYVPERSWIARNAGVVATVASTVLSLGVTLFIALRP